MRDLVTYLALSGRTLAEWTRTELASGIVDPPKMFIRPSIEDPELFTLDFNDEIVMGAWGIAQALEADAGERVTAGDVFAFLITRASRREVNVMRATRAEDFDFVSGQIVDLRNPGPVDERDESIVACLNKVLAGVEHSMMIRRPVIRRNEDLQREEMIYKQAQARQADERRQAEYTRMLAEKNRLAKLLAGAA